jgi:hypothetical protein
MCLCVIQTGEREMDVVVNRGVVRLLGVRRHCSGGGYHNTSSIQSRRFHCLVEFRHEYYSCFRIEPEIPEFMMSAADATVPRDGDLFSGS